MIRLKLDSPMIGAERFDQTTWPHYSAPIRSLNRPPTLSNNPPSARGSSFVGCRIAFFVNPAVTSPVRARAVHQLGATAGFFGSFPGARASTLGPRTTGRGAEDSAMAEAWPPASARFSLNPDGGISESSRRPFTSDTRRIGSNFVSVGTRVIGKPLANLCISDPTVHV